MNQTKLTEYDIEKFLTYREILGCGGYGFVRLCKNRIDGKMYAVKCIQKSGAQDKNEEKKQL